MGNNSLRSAKFRGLVEILCEGEPPLTDEAFHQLVNEIDLFAMEIEASDFVSKFSLEDAKLLVRKRPRQANLLAQACLAHLHTSIAQLFLCRLLPAHFMLHPTTTTTTTTPSPPEDSSAEVFQVDDVVLAASQHCIDEALESEGLRRLFVLANSRTLFCKQPCVDRTGSLLVVADKALIPRLFASSFDDSSSCTGFLLHSLAVLSDVKHDDFVGLPLLPAVQLVRSRLEQRRDVMPSLVILLRLCEDDVLPGLVAEAVNATGESLQLHDFCDIAVSLAELIAEHCAVGPKKDASLVQLCSVALLCLSSHRRLAIRLACNDGQSSASSRRGRGQRTMDVLVKHVISFLREGDLTSFAPVQRLCLTALTNLSYYARSLSMPSANALVLLFERCVKCNRMDSASLLVSLFANMLQYQSQSNAALVYCMFRVRTAFQSLEFTPKPGDENFNHFGDDLRICLLAMDEIDDALLADDGGSSMDEILARIAAVSLIGALPVPRPMLVSQYARSDRIDQVIRKSFWIDLYQSNEEYWDWTA